MNFKRCLSLVLALILCVSVLPFTVAAADSETDKNEIASVASGFASKTQSQPSKSGKECTVTFNMNGKGKQIPSQKVLAGNSAEMPKDPTCFGYVFKGWYTQQNGGTAFNFSTSIHMDTTLYARWELDPVLLTMINIGIHTIESARPDAPNTPDTPDVPSIGDNRIAVTGQVVLADASGARAITALKDVAVKAYDANNNLVYATLSDKDGIFTLRFKEAGTYKVTYSKWGYETVTEEAVVIAEDTTSLGIIAMSEEEVSEVTVNAALGIIQNDQVVCEIDDNKIYLTNRKTGRVLEFKLPSIRFDDRTSDIWEVYMEGNNVATFSTITSIGGDEQNLWLLSEATRDGFTYTAKITISLVNSEAHFSAAITNANDSSVVVYSTFPQMDLTSLSNFNVLWPYKDGELHALKNVIALGGTYPSNLSMQLVTFYDEDEAIYYYCADEEFIYKYFQVESDKIYVQQFPYIAPGETKTTADVVIGFENTWETASDMYREWHLEATGGEREKNSVSGNVTGINCIFVSTYDGANDKAVIQVPYNQIASQAKSLRTVTGTNMTILFGWHKDGFDTRYPEFEFYEELGGADAFADAIDQIHADGGYAIAYTNGHIAETESDWYKLYGADNAIIKSDGTLKEELYGTGLDYVAMCPSAPGFQEAFKEAATRLRQAGVDGLWIDQLMEMPAYLCYNKNHGHTTPANAYYNGYTKLINDVDKIMETYGAEGQGWFYSCEGICDAYSALIDVSTSVWSNTLGYSPVNCPEFSRYTMDLDVLGISHVPAVLGSNGYGRAFLMSMPILSGHGNRPNQECKDITSIYAKNPKLYLDGEYLGQWSATAVSNNKGVLYSSLIAEDRRVGDTILDRISGNTVALQLYYTETAQTVGQARTVTQTFDFERELASAIDAATGLPCTISGSTVTVSINPGQVKSIICTFK